MPTRLVTTLGYSKQKNNYFYNINTLILCLFIARSSDSNVVSNREKGMDHAGYSSI